MKKDYLTAAKLIQMITDYAKQSGQSLEDCRVTIQDNWIQTCSDKTDEFTFKVMHGYGILITHEQNEEL